MATQADWRMILGIRQQPNQWAQALSNLPSNLAQGLQIGDYLRERSRENQLQELMRGAIDPQTGMPDQGKIIQAVIQAYPEKAPALMAEMRKQAQYEQSQNALQQYLNGTGAGAGAGAGAGGLATPPSVRALAVAGAGGQPEKALADLAGYENAWQLKKQDMITGVVNGPKGPVEVSDTKENWDRYRQNLQPGPAQPQAPAIGSNLTPGDRQEMQAPPQAGDIMDKAAWDRLRNSDPNGARAFLRKMPLEQRNLFVRSMYAENGPQVAIPATPSQSLNTGLPPGAIQHGLSPAQQQAIRIQEEARAVEIKKAEELRAAEIKKAQEARMVEFEKAKEARNIEMKKAEEARALQNKGLAAGDQSWVENTLSPALKEYPTNNVILNDLSTMERLNKEGKTGPGSEFQLALKRGLVSAGMLDPKAVATEQQIIALSNTLTWNTLTQQKGPQTDNDFSRMQAIWPNIFNAGEANQFLIDSKRAILSRRQKQIEFYRNNYKDAVATGNVMGLEDAWAQTSNAQKSIWDEPAMKKWSLKYPLPDQPQPENQTGELKFNHPQQSEIDKIKARLRGGG